MVYPAYSLILFNVSYVLYDSYFMNQSRFIEITTSIKFLIVWPKWKLCIFLMKYSFIDKAWFNRNYRSQKLELIPSLCNLNMKIDLYLMFKYRLVGFDMVIIAWLLECPLIRSNYYHAWQHIITVVDGQLCNRITVIWLNSKKS